MPALSRRPGATSRQAPSPTPHWRFDLRHLSVPEGYNFALSCRHLSVPPANISARPRPAFLLTTSGYAPCQVPGILVALDRCVAYRVPFRSGERHRHLSWPFAHLQSLSFVRRLTRQRPASCNRRPTRPRPVSAKSVSLEFSQRHVCGVSRTYFQGL